MRRLVFPVIPLDFSRFIHGPIEQVRAELLFKNAQTFDRASALAVVRKDDRDAFGPVVYVVRH